MAEYFNRPKPERTTFDKIGGALAGFGAGYQGRGSEFIKMVNDENRLLSEDRKKAAATDVRNANRLIEKGDLAGLTSMFEERNKFINTLGGQSTDTADALELARRAETDPMAYNQLKNELYDAETAAIDGGFLNARVAAPTLKAVMNRLTGQKEFANNRQIANNPNLIPIEAKGVTVNTGASPANKGLTEIEVGAAKQVSTIQEMASQSVINLQLADQLMVNLSKLEGSNFETGKVAGFAQGMGNLLLSLGVGKEYATEIAASESFEALSTKLQFAETQILKGAISEKEQTMAAKINTILGSTMLGNKFAIKRLKASSKMSIIRDEIVGRMLDDGQSASSSLRSSNKLMQSLPYVSEVLKDADGLNEFFADYAITMMRETDLSIEEIGQAFRAREKAAISGAK